MILLGKILGWLIISAFALALLNYPVKLVNRKLVSRLQPQSRGRLAYQAFMKAVVRWHRYFALLAVVLLLAHFLVQFSQYGIRPSGVVAGALLLIQVALGAFGTYIRKKKHTAWFYFHRATAVLMLAAFAVHIFRIWWILR